MRTRVEKMELLQEKMSKLKVEQAKIEQEIIDNFVQVLKRKGAFQMDFESIVGGLLEVIDVIHSNPEKMEDWRSRGQKFCKSKMAAKHEKRRQTKSKMEEEDV